MNNIYKVIWSKAKNCYVVASEIARSHTKSASGSEKIGGGTRRKLLASLMALSLLCGGLGVANAENGTVHVADIAATETSKEVYTAEKVNTLLGEYGKKSDVENNANNITTMNTTITTQGQSIATNVANIANNTKAIEQKINTETANERFATKDALRNLQSEVTGKVDENTFEGALDLKADTDLGNLTDEGKAAIKNAMSEDMKLKADKTYVDTEVGKVNTKLAGYAETADLNIATGRIDDNEADIAKLKGKTAEISHADGAGTSISGVTIKDGNIIGNNSAITGLTNVETGSIKTDSINGKNLEGHMVATDKDVENAVKAETELRKAADTELEGKITTLDRKVTTDINELKAKDTDLANKIQTNAADIQTNKNAIAATDKRTGGITRNDAATETKIEGHVTVDILGNVKAKGNVTADGKLKGDGVDAGTGDITTDGAVNAGSLKVENDSNLKGDVTMDKKLSVTGDTSLGKTDVGGALNVTGESNLQGNVILGKNTANTVTVNGKSDFKEAVEMDNGLTVTSGDTTLKGKLTVTDDAELKNTTVGGTLGVTGETTLGDKLTVKGEAKFEKNVTVDQDLTVTGKLNVGKISMKNDELDTNGDQHHSTTTITADGISNNVEVTDRNGVKTESKFTHDKEGSTTYAHKGDAADWKESTSNVTADGVENVAKDSKDNNNTFTQTSTDTKNILKDKDGNTSTTRQDSKGIYGYAKDKDGNKSYTKQEGNRIAESVIGQDGKQTKSEMTSTDITNTAKDGTITNTAKNVTNEGTESVTNKVGNNEVKVSQNGVDIKAEAGKKITESVGTASRVVENAKITDNAGDSTVTTEKDKGTTFGKVGSTGTTNIYGDSIKTGTINAEDTTTGKLTAGAAAGADGGRLTVDADGVKGSYKSGDYTSRSYILANTLMSGVDNGKKPTDADFVGSRTDHYMDGDKAKLDETVKDVAGSNVTNKTSTDTVTTITDGKTTTKTEQGVKDITNTATDGTITNNAKDIVNDAQETITNTAGTSITNQVKDSKVTTDVDGTTFENKTAAVSDGGTTTTKINGNRINTGRVDANELGVSDVDGDNTTNLTVQAGEDGGVKASAGNGTTTGSLDVTAEEVGSSVTDASGKGSTFKQRIDKIMMESKDVSINAEETLTNEAKDIVTNASNSITEKVGETNVTTKTTTSSTSEIQNADTITSVQQTEKMVQSYVGKKDLSATNVTTNFANASANQVTENGQISTVLNNKDGLLIQNNANGNSFTTADGTNTGPALEWTNIKGNEISTGKVEANYVKMGYADVMKDLGVHGNAKVGQNLEVGGTSMLKGDVNMGSNATVEKDLNVKGTTTTKTLNVTGNATVGGTLDVTQRATFHDAVDITKDLSVGGDVTAKSYKVGDKTYISAAGINANDQKITNVADGSISEGSKDAVNGGQLYGVKRDLEHQVDKVGANAAAMANLHPMEFDPSSKWNIAAAIGNYGSETAAALGAFYRPNDDVMVNLSTAFGTGENMVGGGVSVRLGKGSNKLSREESNALKDQVDDLTARMDALLSVLNPNMSKDFPDVPENHWAYEAVSRLAGNDIVQGYPDGEFHGERTMTRYEMAEIIYNALSRGAEAERELVEEFKPELQAMAASEKATAERAEG